MIAADGVCCTNCKVKGFGFRPTDEELVEHHLKPKTLDPDSDRHYIGEVKDLTRFEPSDLFRNTQKNPDDKEGYFFLSPTYKNGRIIRKGKNGFWSETRGFVPIDSEGVAKKRVFVFCQGVYPGTRTAWFIHQFELRTHQEIFLCKLVEHKQKDRVCVNKRKAEHNVPEVSAKPKRGRIDNSLREKEKFSSAKEAQLDDEHNSNKMSCEVPHGSLSLPSGQDSSILTVELTPQSHHLPSKHFIDDASNILMRGYPRSTLHPSNGFLDDIQNISDNQQCHHLSSKSINSSSTCIEMQPNDHFPSSSSTAAHPMYNFPLNSENDIIPSELTQWGHHLPSKCKETITGFDAYQENHPELEAYSLDEDANHYTDFNIDELLEMLEQPQPPTKVQSCDVLPPSSDLSRGDDKFQDRGNSEEDYASFWDGLQLD